MTDHRLNDTYQDLILSLIYSEHMQHGRSGQDEEFKTGERLYQLRVVRHLFKKEYREIESPEELD